MASEYLKWKFRDVKPEEKPVYTRKQKFWNWWDYHIGWMVLALVLVIGGVFLVRDMFFRPEPDYAVGYVSRTALPDEVETALRERLQELGEDVNGDGQVLVELYTYTVGFDRESKINVDETSAAFTGMTVELTSGKIGLVLLDDPEGFQARIGALGYPDGSPVPEDQESFGSADWQNMVYAWEDCPVLAALDLGTFTRFLDLEETPVDGQTALSGMYIGRRALRNEQEQARFAADARLWETLTAGAAPLTEEENTRR